MHRNIKNSLPNFSGITWRNEITAQKKVEPKAVAKATESVETPVIVGQEQVAAAVKAGKEVFKTTRKLLLSIGTMLKPLSKLTRFLLMVYRISTRRFSPRPRLRSKRTP